MGLCLILTPYVSVTFSQEYQYYKHTFKKKSTFKVGFEIISLSLLKNIKFRS